MPAATTPKDAPPPATTVRAAGCVVITGAVATTGGGVLDKLRQQTAEPVFGIIKSVMGFRQFLTRGLANVQGEWTLVCLAWNLKRMAVLRLQ